MIFCLAASIIVGTVGFILAEPILHLMKTPAEVIPDSVLYLHIYFAGTFFNLVYNMVSSILRAVGDSKRPLYVLIITCLLNILLDVVFVVIFHMGVLGVALATVSCQAVSAILVTWFLMRAEDIYRLEFHEIRFDLRSLGAVLRIGLPAGLESVMYNIANLTIQILSMNWGLTQWQPGELWERLMRCSGWYAMLLPSQLLPLWDRIMVPENTTACEKVSASVW